MTFRCETPSCDIACRLIRSKREKNIITFFVIINYSPSIIVSDEPSDFNQCP